MTAQAAQIYEALLKAPREERIRLAAQLLAHARDEEDRTIDEPLPQLGEDRDQLIAHLNNKRK